MLRPGAPNPPFPTSRYTGPPLNHLNSYFRIADLCPQRAGTPEAARLDKAVQLGLLPSPQQMMQEVVKRWPEMEGAREEFYKRCAADIRHQICAKCACSFMGFPLTPHRQEECFLPQHIVPEYMSVSSAACCILCGGRSEQHGSCGQRPCIHCSRHAVNANHMHHASYTGFCSIADPQQFADLHRKLHFDKVAELSHSRQLVFYVLGDFPAPIINARATWCTLAPYMQSDHGQLYNYPIYEQEWRWLLLVEPNRNITRTPIGSFDDLQLLASNLVRPPALPALPPPADWVPPQAARQVPRPAAPARQAPRPVAPPRQAPPPAAPLQQAPVHRQAALPPPAPLQGAQEAANGPAQPPQPRDLIAHHDGSDPATVQAIERLYHTITDAAQRFNPMDPPNWLTTYEERINTIFNSTNFGRGFDGPIPRNNKIDFVFFLPQPTTIHTKARRIATLQMLLAGNSDAECNLNAAATETIQTIYDVIRLALSDAKYTTKPYVLVDTMEALNDIRSADTAVPLPSLLIVIAQPDKTPQDWSALMGPQFLD